MSRTPRIRTFALAAVTAVAVVAPVAPAAAHDDRGGRFPETVALPPGSLPEGITSHGTTFYAGSRLDGSIVRGDLRTGASEPFVAGSPGGVAVGMLFEPFRHRLWVAGGGTGDVVVYDARSGAELGRWHTEDSGFLNDVAITRDAVYVTDSTVQRLVVIPLGRHGELPPGDGATTRALTGDISFVTTPNPFNANGIRALSDRSLILVQGNLGKLFRVDARTGETREISVSGGTLSGGDGLVLLGRTLYVVRGFNNDEVVKLRLGFFGNTARIVDTIKDDDLDVPTTGTIAAGRLWVVNARFTTPPTPTTEYWIARLPLSS